MHEKYQIKHEIFYATIRQECKDYAKVSNSTYMQMFIQRKGKKKKKQLMWIYTELRDLYRYGRMVYKTLQNIKLKFYFLDKKN